MTGKLRKALGHAPARFGRGARDRRGDRLLHAQPAARRRDRRGGGHRHLAGDARGAVGASAAELGLTVETAACEAAALPFEDDSFDLVFGHAVLHHLPDLDAAFREFRRVLRPGGTVAFCGEPSRYGDRLARCPSAARYAVGAAVARRCCGASERRNERRQRRARRGGALEQVVDVHAFTPGDLERHAPRGRASSACA